MQPQGLFCCLEPQPSSSVLASSSYHIIGLPYMKVVVNTFLKLVITIIVASLALCEWLVFLCVRFVFNIASEDFQKKCPRCQNFKHERIHRKWWMRLIPGTKYYSCNRCRSKFMIIFWRSALTTSQKRTLPLSVILSGFLSLPKTRPKTHPGWLMVCSKKLEGGFSKNTKRRSR